MGFLSYTAILVAICGLAAAGHLYHIHDDFDHDGGHGEEVSYSVATTHEDGGHAGAHDDGHHSVHEWSHDAGHDSGHDSGHDWSNHGDHDDGSHDDGHGHHAYPKYEFDYGVKDTKTGDIKGHSESRDGDKVKGSYTLKESDGTTRLVEYSSDKKKGFTAVVHKLGHATADHGSHGHHGSHGAHEGHAGDGGHASSFVVVKKQEGKKH